MTVWYFDSDGGSDSNNGKSEGAAKKFYETFVLAGFPGAAQGDTYLFKRGTTQVISAANVGAGSGASTTQRTRYGAYGVAQVPYSIWTPPPTGGLNNAYVLNVSGKSYIDFEDMYFDGLGRATYTLYMLASGATQNSGHAIRRCFFTNTATAALGIPNGSGLIFGGTDTSTGDTGDYLIEDSEFFGNPVHGMIVNGAHDVVVRRCKFYRNGFDAPTGGHGFSSKYRLQEFTTSGWTNTSGTIWSRALAAYQLDVYYVITNVSNYGRLTKNISTPTTPAAGEFGVSAGTLYINVGSSTDPKNQSVRYAWGRCYNILVEDCEAWGNFNDPRATDVEGHGFAFDNWADSSIFRRNYSHDNQGAGFSLNLGDNNTVESCIATRNQAAGFQAASAKGSMVNKNTFVNNNLGQVGIRANGEIVMFPNCGGGEIKQNILQNYGNRQYAADIFPDVTGVSADRNVTHGYPLLERAAVLQNTIIENPYLDGEFRPSNPAVIRAGNNLGGKDFYGKQFYSQPNIGAVEDVSATQRRLFVRAK